MVPTTGPPSATARPIGPRPRVLPQARPRATPPAVRRAPRAPSPRPPRRGRPPGGAAPARAGGADAEEPQLRGCRDEGGRTLGRDGAPPAGEADEQKSAE